MAARKNLTEEAGTLGSLLRLPYQALSRRLYRDLARSYPEIRPAHGVVLRYLPPGGARVTDLAEQAQMTKQSMGYLVERLQESGYVHLVADVSDGRAKRVRFTAKGEQCLACALALTAQIEAEASSRLPPGEMERLRDLLQKLDSALEERDS